ncbi:protoporphyrinogen oxidase [Kwoniella shandongensis]|uniref:Protoporphyrinogen oxidase n=1 Tax=Kwoniella shandongensis TaxID=1734106 RepID=A0A5M6BZ16_9TREE|nr:protoporphyrinogen oxidase [Kwoniella shandongensis]KAA5527470.1 protoporphyrinogen oxidase [Kwoniella shandongensis]
MPAPPPRHITILGAGLTGLSTAFHLSRNLPSSSKITLVEGSSRLGGWVDSRAHDVGYKDKESGELIEGKVVLETGPRSIRPRGSRGAASMLRMIRDLGLVDSIVPIPFSHPSAKNRFLLDTSTSKLTALPSSPLSLLRSQPPLLRGLLSSFASEPFKNRPVTAVNDESVDSFFRRRFGPNIADNLASAMVHGIYATSSKTLSLRSAFPILWEAEQKYGSVVVGMLMGTKSRQEREEERTEWAELGVLGKEREKWSLYGLKGGLGTLTNHLKEFVIRENRVEIRSDEMVNKIEAPSRSTTTENVGNEETTMTIHTSSGRTYETSHLISALPSSKLPIHGLPNLSSNPSTSVGVVNLVYPLPPSAIHPPGFGYLVPRPNPSTTGSNPSGVLGVIFDSTALPSDPPELGGGITKLTLMIGGPYWSTYQPRLSPPENADDLIPLAIDHLNTVFPQLKNVEPILKIANLHTNCIPTYLPGHGDRLRELHEAIEDGPWGGRLSLVGNSYGGVGVNDCVYSGELVAKGLAVGKGLTGLGKWAKWE